MKDTFEGKKGNGAAVIETISGAVVIIGIIAVVVFSLFGLVKLWSFGQYVLVELRMLDIPVDKIVSPTIWMVGIGLAVLCFGKFVLGIGKKPIDGDEGVID